jgi:hypothetical protein
MQVVDDDMHAADATGASFGLPMSFPRVRRSNEDDVDAREVR